LTDTSLEISVPINSRHPLDTIIVIEYKEPIIFDVKESAEDDVYGLADGL
jgi:hypothetical protein